MLLREGCQRVGLFAVGAPRYSAGMTDRDLIIFDLCMALLQVLVLLQVPPRRLPGDELAEKFVAEKILEHLVRCGWQIERLSDRATPLAP